MKYHWCSLIYSQVPWPTTCSISFVYLSVWKRKRQRTKKILSVHRRPTSCPSRPSPPCGLTTHNDPIIKWGKNWTKQKLFVSLANIILCFPYLSANLQCFLNCKKQFVWKGRTWLIFIRWTPVWIQFLSSMIKKISLGKVQKLPKLNSSNDIQS